MITKLERQVSLDTSGKSNLSCGLGLDSSDWFKGSVAILVFRIPVGLWLSAEKHVSFANFMTNKELDYDLCWVFIVLLLSCIFRLLKQ